VRLNDRTANRQAETVAGFPRSAVASGKTFEQILLVPDRDSRSVIVDRYFCPGSSRDSGNVDMRIGPCELCGVFDEVNQYAFDEHSIETEQRKTGWHLRRDQAPCQPLTADAQRAPDDFLQHVPFQSN